MHGFEQSITITLPPMSTLYFEVPTKRTRKAAADKTDKAGKKTAAKKGKDRCGGSCSKGSKEAGPQAQGRSCRCRGKVGEKDRPQGKG